jgi:capsular exopolysaccharide synthesis family protein
MGKMYDTLVRSQREGQQANKQTEKSLFNKLFQKTIEPEASDAFVQQQDDPSATEVHKLPEASSLSILYREQYHKPAEEGGIDTRLLVYYEPRSKEAEQFRILRARLRKFAEEKQHKMLLVLGTCPQEGKSFIASNLAISICQAGNSPVLLMDGDLRRPNLHKLFGLTAPKGLADYLAGTASFDEIVCVTDVAGLYVIPAGDIPHNPSELIASDRMKLFLNNIKTKFSSCWLIIDSPPVISTPEPAILIEHADGFIYVIQADKTNKKLVKESLSQIDTSKLLGVVLNRIAYQAHNYYYYTDKEK